SNKLNEIMKVMAMIATLFIPLTLIAGIYGMNFKHMPELEWAWGYPLVLAIMGISAGGMVWVFRKRKWL
ncbi:MAG: magnesium and cobalt transport protein CorA, partial [Nitrospirota bacterium]|nr:magnesium and cobalt transport protein CorA [Nitrospirota bacterium]